MAFLLASFPCYIGPQSLQAFVEVSRGGRGVATANLGHQYDLVTAFECVHDMSDPVGALRAMLGLAGENGTVIVMDERVGDTFTAKGNDVE